jgi:hypothetical protein
MLKCTIKWSGMNSNQRNQVKQFYKEQLRNKELFEHSLNKRSYPVNPLTGDVRFVK